MKIVVTGGAGFIGSHIVDEYINAGHDVIIIDDFSSGFRGNVHPLARIIEMNICDESIQKVFEDEKPDILNHHAAQIDVRVSVKDPKHDAMVNIIGSLNLYQAAISSGVKKVIFASSAGTVYGEQEAPLFDETTPCCPVAPYGVSKLANEYYLYTLQQTAGLKYVVMRYANVYGPRQNPHGEAGVIAIFLHKMLRGEQPIINGNGMQTRDYVYIKDIVRANTLALADDVQGVYNFSSARETNVVEILHSLNNTSGLDVATVHAPAKPGEQMRGCYAYTKAESELGWKPEWTFESGIGETYDWFKNNHV